jgi:hypothetical protein
VQLHEHPILLADDVQHLLRERRVQRAQQPAPSAFGAGGSEGAGKRGARMPLVGGGGDPRTVVLAQGEVASETWKEEKGAAAAESDVSSRGKGGGGPKLCWVVRTARCKD